MVRRSCSVAYSLEPDGSAEADEAITFPPGACTLMATGSGDRTAFYKTRGQGVPFVSEVR